MLDDIFVDTDLHIKPGISISDVSDHLPVFAITSTLSSLTDDSTHTHKVRCINDETLNKLYSEVQQLTVDSIGDANKSYNAFISNFTDLYDRCFIYKEQKFKKCILKDYG